MNSDANITAHLSIGPKTNGKKKPLVCLCFLPVSVDDLF